MSPLLFVSVVGIARVGADIYRVECICEVLCGVEVADRRVIAGTHKQRKILWNCRTDLGLYVQSGMLEKSAL